MLTKGDANNPVHDRGLSGGRMRGREKREQERRGGENERESKPSSGPKDTSTC
jgi:hypothetical protein